MLYFDGVLIFKIYDADVIPLFNFFKKRTGCDLFQNKTHRLNKDSIWKYDVSLIWNHLIWQYNNNIKTHFILFVIFKNIFIQYSVYKYQHMSYVLLNSSWLCWSCVSKLVSNISDCTPQFGSTYFDVIDPCCVSRPCRVQAALGHLTCHC